MQPIAAGSAEDARYTETVPTWEQRTTTTN